MDNHRKLRVSVVGATGLVGREMIKLLESRRFPVGELHLFASERSIGQELEFRGKGVPVDLLTRQALLDKSDVVFASAGAQVSGLLREWVREGKSPIVIDNSSAFRMDDEVPLVVPEVNPDALRSHNGYIANPNCTTIPVVMALKALEKLANITEVTVSTYQSVSGAGNKGMEELASQTLRLLLEEQIEIETFPHRIAFNLIPQIGSIDHTGYSQEELKVRNETRKILGRPGLPVTCTAVRVPTFACHGEAVSVTLDKDLSRDEVTLALAAHEGITVLDAPREMVYPMPVNVVDTEHVFIGRVRKHLDIPARFELWVVSDNLLKGAALNNIQIAEKMISMGLL